MNVLTVLLLLGLVALLLQNPSGPSPEIVYVPIAVEHPQQGMGCVPPLVIVLLILLALALLTSGSGTQGYPL